MRIQNRSIEIRVMINYAEVNQGSKGGYATVQGQHRIDFMQELTKGNPPPPGYASVPYAYYNK